MLSYDDASNMLTCNNANANITRAYYADFLLHYESETVLKENDNIARTIYYTYDDDGNRATAVYPTGVSFKYDYTGREQLLDIFNQNQPSAAQVTYTHNPNGLRTLRVILGKNTWADPNFTTYGYDSATKSRLMSSQHAWSTSQTNWTRDFNYGYDAVGNLTYEMRDWAQQGDGFQYDKNNQITGYQREGTVNTTTGGVSAPQDNDSLSFDPSGNRTSVSDNGTTTTYAAANVLNQYTSINGAGLTYDGNGNLASYSGGSFTYNAQNQLTHAVSGANYAYFSYDGFGRICVSQVSGSTGIHINFYDGWNLADEYRTGNTLDAEYLWGEGELVSRRSGGQTVALYYYQDGRGNTSQVADNNAIVQENYKYQLNGAPLIYDTNGVQQGESGIGNRFLCGGQEYFSDLGIINLRHRFYLTNLGRFLQPDPTGFGGDAANIYRYCGNNPANGSDTSGLNVSIGWYDIGHWELNYWGHIGLGINTTMTRGFDSANGSFSGKGVLHRDTARLRAPLLTIYTTPAQDAIIAKAFARFNGTHYNLLNRNCAVAVETALRAAGLKFKGSNLPNVLFRNLKQAFGGRNLNHSGGEGGPASGGGEQGFGPGASSGGGPGGDGVLIGGGGDYDTGGLAPTSDDVSGPDSQEAGSPYYDGFDPSDDPFGDVSGPTMMGEPDGFTPSSDGGGSFDDPTAIRTFSQPLLDY